MPPVCWLLACEIEPTRSHTCCARKFVYNTFDAHRLLHWARLEGRQLPLKLALLRAYQGEGKDTSNRDVLVDAARSVGLDADKAREVLESSAYADEVRAEE